MHRREEILLRRNSFGFESFRQGIAVHAESVWVHEDTEVLMTRTGTGSDALEFHSWNRSEFAFVSLHLPVPGLHVPVEMHHELESNDRIDFGHPGIEPGNVASVVGMVPVVPEIGRAHV